MKIIVLTAMLVLISMPSLAAERTPLSIKAAKLELGMTRKQVIGLLGPAIWAIIPSDNAERTLNDPRVRLELYWKNGLCMPVAVQFDAKEQATGWDEGRALCGQQFAPMLALPNTRSCQKSDRSKLCR